MTKKIIRIGTRGSKLALYQANKVKKDLAKKDSQHIFEVTIIKTKGDKILDVPLAKIGDKGLFTKELEIALFDGRIDMAVHSLKDLPTVYPEGAKLGAVLERADNRDALVSLTRKSLKDLRAGDVVATSSLRRKAQLLAMNKELKIVDIRGNVNTRIRKMEEGYCDAMIMAAAGIQRLEMEQYISELIDPEKIIPACGQGAIAIEIRENDNFIQDLVKQINDHDTSVTTTAERVFLNCLEGGCQIPIGSYAVIRGNKLYLTGYLSGIEGENPIILRSIGSADVPVALGEKLAAEVIKAGGDKIVADLRALNEETSGGQLLNNIKIISTRPPRENDLLQEKIEKEGGSYISIPTIEIKPNNLSEADKRILAGVKSFDWIIFTSKNGVHHFFEQLNKFQGSSLLSTHTKFAVMGGATAKELESFSYYPEFINKGNTSIELLEHLEKEHSLSEKRILLALGNLAGDILFNGLKDKAKIERIDVYKTDKPDLIEESKLQVIKDNDYDLVIFTSPSAFNNLIEIDPQINLSDLKAASIGPTTSKAMEDKGIKPIIMAENSSMDGLYEAIVKYYKKN